MRTRGPSAALVALVGVVSGAALVAGCGGDDKPTTAEAGTRIASWGANLEGPVVGGLTTTKPWTVSEDARRNERGSCAKDKARRRFAATVTVKGDGSSDAGLESTRLTGALERAGWDADLSSSDGSITASRTSKDATGSKLEVGYALSGGRWSYEVTLRTACLPTSD